MYKKHINLIHRLKQFLKIENNKNTKIQYNETSYIRRRRNTVHSKKKKLVIPGFKMVL